MTIIDDLNLILNTKLSPIEIDEGGRKRTVSITDQKLFLLATLSFEPYTFDEFVTKKRFNELTQLSERFVSRASTALESVGLIKSEKKGSTFRFTVLISAIERLGKKQGSNEQ